MEHCGSCKRLEAQLAECQKQRDYGTKLLGELERERDAAVEALEDAFILIDENYGHGIENGYWPTVAPIHAKAQAALALCEPDE